MADDACQLNCQLDPTPTFPMIQPTSWVPSVVYMCVMTCNAVRVTMFSFFESFLMRIYGGERDAVMARTLSLSD